MTTQLLPEGWWRDFFVAEHLDYHRARWDHTGDAGTTVDRVISLTSLRPGDAVLDVPCGNGRHARQLAVRGMRVLGIDACPEFIAEATEHARSAGHDRTHFECRDMRDLPVTASFDAVVCLGGSFGYFGDEGDAGFLADCARALRPGGWLVLDTATLETIVPVHEPTACERFDGLTAVHRRFLDAGRGLVRLELTVSSPAGEQTRSYHQRLYRHDEIRRMTRRAGFSAERSYGPDRRPFGSTSGRLLLAAQRRPRRSGWWRA